MDRQLLKRLIHTITHTPIVSIDGYGDPVYGTPVNHKCYRYGKITQVRSLSGDMVVSTRQFIMDTILDIKSEDKFTFKGTDYLVLAYEHYDGLKAGTGTTVVYV